MNLILPGLKPRLVTSRFMRFVLPKIKYLIPDFEFLLDAVLTLVVK